MNEEEYLLYSDKFSDFLGENWAEMIRKNIHWGSYLMGSNTVDTKKLRNLMRSFFLFELLCAVTYNPQNTESSRRPLPPQPKHLPLG